MHLVPAAVVIRRHGCLTQPPKTTSTDSKPHLDVELCEVVIKATGGFSRDSVTNVVHVYSSPHHLSESCLTDRTLLEHYTPSFPEGSSAWDLKEQRGINRCLR
ncbi:hypothetical protein BaRGS_00014720 [Batillaria attramentaria]|uniref:Uncharacterized protein n=1 Tax=Batillaria attramentaria TaxID=370345 RepID=A0ABD0L3Z6_9CAEN